MQTHPRLPVSCPCSPMQRQPPQKRSSAGASPAMGTISCLCSSVERVADYESAGRRCESCQRHQSNAPVAQSIERRASNAEAGGESPSGSATSSWNVNRTSGPGLGANEIVPPSCGMRSMSSAFRHFSKPTNAKSSRDRSFKSVLAGASPAVGAISKLMQSNSRGSMSRTSAVRVRVGCCAAYANRQRVESCALAHGVLP